MREDRFAFDQPGIPVGRFLARPAPVDERHRKPALGEMQGDGRADDAGPEHDDVGARHCLLRLLETSRWINPCPI